MSRQLLVCCSYVQVPLGIQLKSEQKYEMVEIRGSLHKYVPRVPTTEMVEVAGCEEPLKVTKSNLFSIGLGKLQCLCFSIIFRNQLHVAVNHNVYYVTMG